MFCHYYLLDFPIIVTLHPCINFIFQTIPYLLEILHYFFFVPSWNEIFYIDWDLFLASISDRCLNIEIYFVVCCIYSFSYSYSSTIISVVFILLFALIVLFVFYLIFFCGRVFFFEFTTFCNKHNSLIQWFLILSGLYSLKLFGVGIIGRWYSCLVCLMLEVALVAHNVVFAVLCSSCYWYFVVVSM